MDKNACGIISYAGLNKAELIAAAKAAFAQAQPPVPQRFDAFLPLFPVELIINMAYIGDGETRGAKVAPSGFSIDPTEYHQKLYTLLPALYTGDNYSRNFDYEGHFVGRGVFAVDTAWVDHFPQYQPFFGEKLTIYLIGGGSQAVAVPQSVYPRGGGVLTRQEQMMHVTQRVALFMQYVKARISAGDTYEAELFAADYLRAAKTPPFVLTQKEIGRILQDMAIVKGLQNENAAGGLYTDNARAARRVFQYMPMRYACDLFTQEAVDKHTARLAQLYDPEMDFVSDLWIPWQDLSAYINKTTMTLDVGALCQGYQIAPRYDAETFGGRYPSAVRVAVVRDRERMLMTGEVINNPAYGDGMGPKGLIGKQVYLADSREMIRQRKLVLEETKLTTQNTTLPPAAYRKALALAILQEHKGRLVDAMYRRETALSQMTPDSSVYHKASQLLGDRVDRLSEIVTRESRQSGRGQMSGYDADIDYLRRMQKEREAAPTGDEPETGKPIAFARDAQREQSIESGYAMRASLIRLPYAQAALPEPPELDEPQSIEPEREPEDAAAAEGLEAEVSTADGAAPDMDAKDTPDEPNAATQAAAPETTPQTVAPVDTVLRETPEAGDETPEGHQAAGVDAALPEAGQSAGAIHAAEPSTAAQAAGVDAGTSEAGQSAGVIYATEPSTATQAVGVDAGTSEAGQSAGAIHTAASSTAAQAAGVDAGTSEAGQSAGAIHATEPSTAAQAANVDAAMPEAGQSAGAIHAAEPSTAAQAAGVEGDGQTTAAEEPRQEPATRRGKRVSLRELSGRIGADKQQGGTEGQEPRTPPEGSGEIPPEEPSPEEPPKPKLAYILRRGSEGAATKSYNRMTEMLNKHKK